jgi:hypothetical protein
MIFLTQRLTKVSFETNVTYIDRPVFVNKKRYSTGFHQKNTMMQKVKKATDEGI